VVEGRRMERGYEGREKGERREGRVREECNDRLQFKGLISLLATLSNNMDAFVIFWWSFTLAIFETIAETTQEILEN